MSLSAGQSFGDYLLERPLGAGGMAVTWRAREQIAGVGERLVALKVIKPEKAADGRFREMFLDEVRISALINHPNVCQIFRAGEIDSTLFMAMEFVDGFSVGELRSRYEGSTGFESDPSALDEIYQLRRAPWPVEHVLFVLASVARGLNAAHTLKDPDGKTISVVHRDVSPQNVMLGHQGEVKVIDFGVAKASINLARTQTGYIKGKVPYMSPEHLEGKTLDGRSDLFGLGLMAYELLAGLHPLLGSTDAATMFNYATREIPPPSSENPAVPAFVDRVVMKCLEKPVEQRWRSAAELERATVDALYQLTGQYNQSDLAAWISEPTHGGKGAADPLAETGVSSSIIQTPAPVSGDGQTHEALLPTGELRSAPTGPGPPLSAEQQRSQSQSQVRSRVESRVTPRPTGASPGLAKESTEHGGTRRALLTGAVVLVLTLVGLGGALFFFASQNDRAAGDQRQATHEDEDLDEAPVQEAEPATPGDSPPEASPTKPKVDRSSRPYMTSLGKRETIYLLGSRIGGHLFSPLKLAAKDIEMQLMTGALETQTHQFQNTLVPCFLNHDRRYVLALHRFNHIKRRTRRPCTPQTDLGVPSPIASCQLELNELSGENVDLGVMLVELEKMAASVDEALSVRAAVWSEGMKTGRCRDPAEASLDAMAALKRYDDARDEVGEKMKDRAEALQTWHANVKLETGGVRDFGFYLYRLLRTVEKLMKTHPLEGDPLEGHDTVRLKGVRSEIERAIGKLDEYCDSPLPTDRALCRDHWLVLRGTVVSAVEVTMTTSKLDAHPGRGQKSPMWAVCRAVDDLPKQGLLPMSCFWWR